jgi:hypothetical protein
MTFASEVVTEGMHNVDVQDRRIGVCLQWRDTPGPGFKLAGRVVKPPEGDQRQARVVPLNCDNVVELDFSCFNLRMALSPGQELRPANEAMSPILVKLLDGTGRRCLV